MSVFDDIDIGLVSFDTSPEKKPQFSVIIGKGGVGKTTTACYSTPTNPETGKPSVMILPVGRETGHERMDVPKFNTFDVMGLSPSDHVMACLAWLIKQPHNLKTLIIDNAGAYREAVDEDIMLKNPKAKVDGELVDVKSINDYGYGKGQAMGFVYWTRLLSGIDMLMKKRKVNVILIGHEGLHTVNKPDGSYYQRISINAPSGANTDVASLIEARCHNFFYMVNEATTAKDTRGFAKGKAYAKREEVVRKIYTKPMGDFFAKSRASIEPFYEIEPSDDDESLFSTKTNETLIKFWSDVYGL